MVLQKLQGKTASAAAGTIGEKDANAQTAQTGATVQDAAEQVDAEQPSSVDSGLPSPSPGSAPLSAPPAKEAAAAGKGTVAAGSKNGEKVQGKHVTVRRKKLE